MRSTIRPLLLALVLVGGVSGDGWMRPEVPDDRMIRGSHGGSVQDAAVTVSDDAELQYHLQAASPASPTAIEVMRFTTGPRTDMVGIASDGWDHAWFISGRTVVSQHGSGVNTQQFGDRDLPWTVPLTIYVRRGVPVTVVEVGP